MGNALTSPAHTKTEFNKSEHRRTHFSLRGHELDKKKTLLKGHLTDFTPHIQFIHHEESCSACEKSYIMWLWRNKMFNLPLNIMVEQH